MPDRRDTWWMTFLPCKKKLAPSLARQIILVLAFLCKGTRCHAGSDYTVTVPPSVSVQIGLAVHIPCQFTYKISRRYKDDDVFAYWFRYAAGNQHCNRLSFLTCDHLVATNQNSRPVESSAKDRFYLIGDPKQGNCSLIILKAQIEDAGQYYLRIEGKENNENKFSFNREGYDISPYVSVTEPPHDIKITVNIERPGSQDTSIQQRRIERGPVVVQEGDTIHLLCIAKGRPNPNLAWMNESKKASQAKNDNVYTLLLYQVGPEDAGEYRCEAKNQFGSVQTTVQVIVQYRPRTVTFSVSQTPRRGPKLTQGCSRNLSNGSSLIAQEGDSLQLRCKADSNPPVNTRWVKVDGHLEVPSDNWLEVANLTVEDEGEYICKAVNALGLVQGIIWLDVAYAPKLSRNPQKNTTCWDHETGFLCSCTFHAQPPPQIEWNVDGKRITEDSSRQGNVTVLTLVHKNEVTSTLNWTGGLDKAPSIVCSGSNSYGVQAVQFLMMTALREPASKSSTGATVFFVAGLCGILLGAGIIVLFLFLMKVRKRKETLSKVDRVEGTISANQRAHSLSQIYSNIFPMVGPRPPHPGQLKVGGGRKPKPAQVSGIPSPRTADPDELQYAALEFKPKCEGVPVARDDYVEYSAIQRK